MIKIIASKYELFSVDIHVELFSIPITDCDYLFTILMTIGDAIFVLDLDLLPISPDEQLRDGLSFTIEEGQFVTDRSRFVLEDDLATSDEGPTTHTLSL